MTIFQEWPEFAPQLNVYITVNQGTLSISAGSAIVNFASFPAGPGEDRGLIGSIWKNGSMVAELTIDANGGLTAPSFAVIPGDVVELRVDYHQRLQLPWFCSFSGRRTAVVPITGLNQATTFDAQNNAMPVPHLDIGFGWNPANNLQVGFKVQQTGGAAQLMQVESRLIGGNAQNITTTSFALVQGASHVHMASFALPAALDGLRVEWRLASAAPGNPLQEDRLRLLFPTSQRIESWSPAFPAAGVLLSQSGVAGELKLSKV
jgi:hypothetical protein